MNNFVYDWIIIGGGISGISIAEILTRENKSVLLIEKNELLASETSKVLQEWVHSGALYTLVPDNLLTLRYLLGASDDLFRFYETFNGMNLKATHSGIKTKGSGWFNDGRIDFRYRIRKSNLRWMSTVSKSINIIDLISRHDWLRKKAGSQYDDPKLLYLNWLQNIWYQFKTSDEFFSIKSPDFTMNSRILIEDLLNVSLDKGLTVVTSQEVLNIVEQNEKVLVTTADDQYTSKNAVICSPDMIAEQFNLPIKKGYAPISVVENLPDDEISFVELDCNEKTCINLLIKGDGYGQAGGITLANEHDIKLYLKYLIGQHKKRNPDLKILGNYVGIKKELVNKNQDRNYLYHINHNSSRIWSVILGKFTLAFSMAPEFYRRVYNENPSRTASKGSNLNSNELISETAWQEIVKLNK